MTDRARLPLLGGLSLLFLAAILAANYVTNKEGQVWVLGFTATAGTYFAGATFVLRDFIQELVRKLLPARTEVVERWETLDNVDMGPGQVAQVRRPHVVEIPPSRWATAAPILGLIVLGAVLSFAISSPALAVASAAAFLFSEAADLCLYTPLRERGFLRAAVVSNVVGALVDTALFLWLASGFLSKVDPTFSVAGSFPGQVVGKLVLTVPVLLAVWLLRRSRA